MIPVRTLSDAEIKAQLARVEAAPELAVEPGAELVFEVARVAMLPPKGELVTWFETTFGQLYRLPAELGEWAHTTIALALTNPGVKLFPSKIRFGRLAENGRWFADFLDDEGREL